MTTPFTCNLMVGRTSVFNSTATCKTAMTHPFGMIHGYAVSTQSSTCQGVGFGELCRLVISSLLLKFGSEVVGRISGDEDLHRGTESVDSMAAPLLRTAAHLLQTFPERFSCHTFLIAMLITRNSSSSPCAQNETPETSCGALQTARYVVVHHARSYSSKACLSL